MALFKSSNPTLRADTFKGIYSSNTNDNVMTLQGTVNKTALLLLAVIIPALYTWNLLNSTENFQIFVKYYRAAALGAFVIAIIIVFKKEWAPYLAFIYSVLQGFILGGLSAIFNYQMPGIVMQALVLTFGIFAILLIIYKLKIIEPTENFKLIVCSATACIALYYLASFILSFFGIEVPFIHENTTAGILFSVFIVVIASMNLVVDFDFIEQGVAQKAPKCMEWYGAFGLMVTLIWLYIEILRLLAKLKKR